MQKNNNNSVLFYLVILISALIPLIPATSSALGKYCDSTNWKKLIQPSSDSLHNLYYKLGTFEETIARREFTKISRDELESKLTAILSSTTTDKDLFNTKRSELLSNLCDGVQTAFLFCRDESFGGENANTCGCKASFPFEYSVVRGNCNARLGSICKIGTDFELTCIEGDCILGKDGETSFCGGTKAFEERRQATEMEQQQANKAENLTNQILLLIVTVTTAFIILFI